MIFFKKLNKKLDKVISLFDNSDILEKIKECERDSSRNWELSIAEHRKTAKLEKEIQEYSNTTSRLQSTISILENKIEYYTGNQESFNLLKKELQNKLDKVEKQEQELKNKQMVLDIKTQEMEKKQCQYIELFSSLNIKYDVKKTNNKKTIREPKTDTIEAEAKADSVKENL